MDQYISIKEAAERLGLSTRTIRNYVDRGVLPAYTVMAQVRLRVEDIESLVKPYVKDPRRGRNVGNL